MKGGGHYGPFEAGAFLRQTPTSAALFDFIGGSDRLIVSGPPLVNLDPVGGVLTIPDGNTASTNLSGLSISGSYRIEFNVTTDNGDLEDVQLRLFVGRTQISPSPYGVVNGINTVDFTATGTVVGIDFAFDGGQELENPLEMDSLTVNSL